MSEISLVVILIAVYFLPFILAVLRKHKNKKALFALNLFGGWTGVGWVGSLVWSLLNEKKVQS